MSSRSSSGRKLTESINDTSSKSQSRHRRAIRLHEQNNDYRRNYRPFIVPSSFYNIVHVHRFTLIDVISTLINHFESCYRYSIDTEKDRFTNDLALIQVHSIPQHLPSFVVLFEINHLPPVDSLLMGKIKLLFTLIFRLGNTIFSWGSMSDELEDAIQMRLFPWPVSASLFNLQEKFFNWYRWALPSCKACGSIRLPEMVSSSTPRCSCTSSFPYAKSTEKWSLQNAICFTINCFLDKSSTRKNWSALLDPHYSSLSPSEQRTRISYAIYDCFGVTLLHRAIKEDWSLIQLRETELLYLFTSTAPPSLPSLSSSMLLEIISEDENDTKPPSSPVSRTQNHPPSLTIPMLLEDISEDESNEDDEIFFSALSSQCQTATPIHTTPHVTICSVTSTTDDIIAPVSLNEQAASIEPPPPRHQCRSIAARSRRNRKRNMVKRSYRDRHVIIRQVHYRFTLRQIKNVLRDRDVRYVHLKLDKSSSLLSIGMKKSSLVDLYFDRLPGDLFDKEHYRQYCRQEH